MSLSLQSIFGIEGKIALVTGGGRGIGRSIVEGFLNAGAAKVYIASRDEAALSETAADLASLGEVIPIVANLGNVAGCKALADEMASREARLDILVNNSGAGWGGPLEDFPEAGWDKVFMLNLKAPFYLTAGLLPLLKAAGTHDDPARIINIGSIAGEWKASMSAYPYGLSKGAVHHLTDMLAKELAEAKITVNAIAPGRFPSKMTKYVMEDQEAYDREVAEIPLHKWGEPQNIAGAALYLASAAGSWVTGSHLKVDGGTMLR